MKRVKKNYLAILLAMVMVLGGFCSNQVLAADDWCPYSPTESHVYQDHHLLGAGYSEIFGPHMHYIPEIGEYVHCDRTKNYEYCETRCVYCHSPEQGSIHTHCYLRHAATNTNEPWPGGD